MKRILKLFTLVGVLALTAGACADPAAGITANDAAASQNGECRDGGYMGSGGGRSCPVPLP